MSACWRIRRRSSPSKKHKKHPDGLVTRVDDGGRGWWLAGYVGVAGFFALEGAARERGSASSLEASADDQGTTRRIAAAYAVAVIASPLLRRLRLRRLPRGAAPVGVAVEAVGLGVRAWSMRTLGRSYSRTLRVEEAQTVVETGPYQLVRHPGYAGSLLIWTGFALSSRSLPVVAAVGALLGSAYRRRIAAEEQLLRRDLPAYAGYCDRTKKLIPFLW
jgi:protein-S-isoprenylcysteine O-methyltransferase Ste14